MKILKKIAAVLAAGVMAMTALCASAGAESALDAKTALTSGKKTTINFDGKNPMSYKIKVAEKGTIKFNYTIESNDFRFFLYDSDGASIAVDSMSSKSGRVYYEKSSGGYVHAQKVYSTGIGSGTFEYKVKKGTYYLMINTSFYSAGKLKLTATFPSSDSSSDAKIDALTINVKKGAELSFGTLITGSADLSDIKWTTSDKAVATVSSSGTVKAVGKGKATITAKLGSSSVKIVVKVS